MTTISSPLPSQRTSPRTRRMAAALAALVAVGTVGTVGLAATSSAKPGTESASAESVTIDKFFTSSTLTAGVTNAGNVQHFQPAGAGNHMFAEGYVACYSGLTAYEIGAGASGWGAPTVSFPSASSMRVVRTTADGKVKLQQDISFASSTKRVTVKSTVTNVSAATLTDVRFSRVADIDANGSGANDVWGRTADSAFAFDDGNGGMAMSHVSASSGVTEASRVNSASPTCSGPHLATPAVGDRAGFLEYTIGNLAAGKSKTITIAYSAL